ncbi:MerR family transcriptional regulator [Virgibacillus sp. NKC19-16]|uniref:MerR family transcriptional regulator n=1 Tax=Virgibacillus salidurans TaxID=2831673 RepID=UPI001F3B1730|nr:MerR family transcriptional regulator [Virgibacillus sp. NKC19-16]UJL47110.1 MerR family transcriptional regulator [Virgibacillus sp. NKC19-16]
MNGKDIAKKLNISTTALKHYERWGIIPEVKRASNGYRIYTKEHEVYFQCIRSLKNGFGMSFIKRVMPLFIKNDITSGLWMINHAQSQLQKDKDLVERTIKILNLEDIENVKNTKDKKHKFSIGEVAKEAGVATSTIRHWEKEDLINPKRDMNSGFRVYNYLDLRRILVIKIIQNAVYSLEVVKETLSTINITDLKETRTIVEGSFEYLDYILMEQTRGVAYVYKLIAYISE